MINKTGAYNPAQPAQADIDGDTRRVLKRLREELRKVVNDKQLPPKEKKMKIAELRMRIQELQSQKTSKEPAEDASSDSSRTESLRQSPDEYIHGGDAPKGNHSPAADKITDKTEESIAKFGQSVENLVKSGGLSDSESTDPNMKDGLGYYSIYERKTQDELLDGTLEQKRKKDEEAELI